MASTFTTSATDSNSPTPANVGSAGALTHVRGTYTVSAGSALVVNDVIQMVPIPVGARVVSCTLHTTDLDSNVSPAVVLDVGDGGDTDRYIDGSTKGQTGGTDFIGTGITTLTQAYTYTADDTVDVLVQTAPATGATTFTIVLDVMYAATAQA